MNFIDSTKKELLKIKSLIDLSNQNGALQDYDIEVDGATVVNRTNNSSFFDVVANFIDENTTNVNVRFFLGKSNNIKKEYSFESKKSELNGFGQTPQEIANRVLEQHKANEEKKADKTRIKELEKEIEALKRGSIQGIHIPTVLSQALTPLIQTGIGTVMQKMQPQIPQLAGASSELGKQLESTLNAIRQRNEGRFAKTIKTIEIITQITDEEFEEFFVENFTDNSNQEEHEQP